MLPSEYLSLSDKERAFIIAAIDIRQEYLKKETAKLKR